jgi:hypothetical protein
MSHITGLRQGRIVNTTVFLHGTRIRAEVVDKSRHTTVTWNETLSAAENHCTAAMACMNGLEPLSYWPTVDGYMFAF